MIEDHQVSNDNSADNKAAKRVLKKPAYTDVGKALKDSPDKTATGNGEVLDWMNFFPR